MKDMSLVDHLEELRGRLIRVAIILFVSFFICYSIGDEIATLLLKPLREAMGAEGKIVYLRVLDKVIAQFQLAFWSSVLLAAPFWFREAWLFIKPGLYPKEIKVIRPFMLGGLILFILGVLFGYFIVFPFTFKTLMNFGVQNIEATLSLKEYLVLATKVLVFLGLLFQLPNLLLILGFMEVVTKYSLAKMRRYVYVAFAVISSLLTPPDPITMMALWIPLVILYEVGVVLVAMIVHPYLRRKYS